MIKISQKNFRYQSKYYINQESKWGSNLDFLGAKKKQEMEFGLWTMLLFEADEIIWNMINSGGNGSGQQHGKVFSKN